MRPTLEFNGIVGGYIRDGVKTVLPSRASVKISCRLVPNQNPERIMHQIREYLLSIAPPTVTVEVISMEDGAPGIVFDWDTAAVRAADQAYRLGWGVEPVYSREGGSIPVVSALAEHLNAQIVLMPFGYKGGGAHSTNEYVVLEMFRKGIDTMLYFYPALVEQMTGTGAD